MIRFNAETIINHLDYFHEIYIVCQSAKRSRFIKNKYFSHYNRIKVDEKLQFSKLNYGSNNVSLNDTVMRINIVGSNSFNFYSVMRIVQNYLKFKYGSSYIFVFLSWAKCLE